MALPRIRVTERQMLLALLAATLVTVAVALLWVGIFPGGTKNAVLGELPRVRWMRGQAISAKSDLRYVAVEYIEPSIMSLPDPRGFSRGAWAHLEPPTQTIYEPERTASFLGAPSGMPAPVLLEEKSLDAHLQEDLQRLQNEADWGIESNEVSLSATGSVVQIGGGLAGRQLIAQPALPPAPKDVAARQTRVFVGVAADGRVRYAVLDKSSGNEALDAEAVELARQLRFEMISSPDPMAVTWGTIRFLRAPAP